MSGLVGYDSSSDEEESSAEQASAPIVQAKSLNAQPSVNGLQHQQAPLNTPLNTAVADQIQENSASIPMVGPSRPDADTVPERSDDLLDYIDNNDDLSERDKIRLLTQTTTPMSEMLPSPPGSPSVEAETKIKKFLELKAKGIHFNSDLASKSSFKNPALLQTMMARAGLQDEDQYATTLPLSIWNPACFPPSAYKEELLKSQQSLADQESSRKKALSASGKRTIEFTPASGSSQSSRTSTPASLKQRRE